MGTILHEFDSQASLEQFVACREVPTLKNTGLSGEGYRKLVSDCFLNLESFAYIVSEFEGALEYEERVENIIGPDGGLAETVDSDWHDPVKLRKMLNETKILLNGVVTSDTLSCAQSLCVAYRHIVLKNLDSILESISDQNDSIIAAREGIRRLSVEKNEPETLSEIEDYLEIIETCSEIEKDEKEDWEEEMTHLRMTIQASHYVSSILLNYHAN